MFVPKKTIDQMVQEAKTRVQNLSLEQLQVERESGQAVQVIDIRDIRERKKLGWIPGALHVPRGMLEFWLDSNLKILQRQGRSGKADHPLLSRRWTVCPCGGRASRNGVSQRRAPRSRIQRLGCCGSSCRK